MIQHKFQKIKRKRKKRRREMQMLMILQIMKKITQSQLVNNLIKE